MRTLILLLILSAVAWCEDVAQATAAQDPHVAAHSSPDDQRAAQLRNYETLSQKVMGMKPVEMPPYPKNGGGLETWQRAYDHNTALQEIQELVRKTENLSEVEKKRSPDAKINVGILIKVELEKFDREAKEAAKKN